MFLYSGIVFSFLSIGPSPGARTGSEACLPPLDCLPLPLSNHKKQAFMNEKDLFQSILDDTQGVDGDKLVAYIIYKLTMTEACARSTSAILSSHLSGHLKFPLSENEAKQALATVQLEIRKEELDRLSQLSTTPISDLSQLFLQQKE